MAYSKQDVKVMLAHVNDVLLINLTLEKVNEFYMLHDEVMTVYCRGTRQECINFLRGMSKMLDCITTDTFTHSHVLARMLHNSTIRDITLMLHAKEVQAMHACGTVVVLQGSKQDHADNADVLFNAAGKLKE